MYARVNLITINNADNPNIYLNPRSYIIPHKKVPIASPREPTIYLKFVYANCLLCSILLIYGASVIFSYAVEINNDQVIAHIIIKILLDKKANKYPKNLIPNLMVIVR